MSPSARHLLLDMVTIALCAAICGANSWVDVETFGDAKREWFARFLKLPNGIPSLEDRVNAFYTYGVKRGRLDLHRFVDAASTQSAKLFGLFPRKGTIQLGSDADRTLWPR